MTGPGATPAGGPSESSTGTGPDPVATFEAERPRLLGLAYRLLGSVADAEDVVQEAWLRWERSDRSTIERPVAWLTTVVSRLGLDRLRARQREQADYVGPWLPEPIVRTPGPEEQAEVADSLTTAFLLLLERLEPAERLVVLLADVFDEPFSTIAPIVGKSEAATRQMAVRARRKLRAGDDDTLDLPHRAPPAEQQRLAAAFLAAAAVGDRDALLSLLAPDVVLLSDGGARVHAARRPVVGPERVARFVINLAARSLDGGVIEPCEVNGVPGVTVRVQGVPEYVFAIEVGDAGVERITAVRNPDKLGGVDRSVDLV